MGFKLVICPPNYQEDWPAKLKEAVPDIDIHLCPSVGEAMEVIGDADAAFGDIVPELFERAQNLRWIACPQAGPRAGTRRMFCPFYKSLITTGRSATDLSRCSMSTKLLHLSWSRSSTSS